MSARSWQTPIVAMSTAEMVRKEWDLATQWWVLRMLGVAEATVGCLVLAASVTLLPPPNGENDLGTIVAVFGIVLIVSGCGIVYSTRDHRIHPVTLILIWMLAAAIAPMACRLWLGFVMPFFAASAG